MLKSRLFRTYEELVEFVNSTGVIRVAEHEWYSRWTLYYEDLAVPPASGVLAGPFGEMVLSQKNLDWWVKGSVEATLPPDPMNPGHINTTYDGDDRVWRIYELDVYRLANELKDAILEHFGEAPAIHGAADGRTISSPDATDELGLYALLNEEKEVYNLHHVDVTGGIHGAATDPNAVTAADATDNDSARTLALDILENYEAHRVNIAGGVHGAADTENTAQAFGLANQFSYADVDIHGTWGGGETIKVYAVNVHGVEILLATALAADASNYHLDARTFAHFRLDTAGLVAGTEVAVDIALY